MADLKNLYRAATGNAQLDASQIVSDASSLSDEEKVALLDRLMSLVPGGVAGANFDALRVELNTELFGGSLGDVTGDGKVTKDDVEEIVAAVKAGSTDTKYDVNKDTKVDANDAHLASLLSVEVDESSDE